MRARCIALALVLFACLAQALPCHAQQPLELREDLAEQSLDGHVSYLFSRDRTLTIDAVSKLPKARFRAGKPGQSNFGYTDQVLWIRLDVQNTRDVTSEWLFELAYPLIDDLTLFQPDAQGRFQAHQTGDRRPFATRDLAYRTFVFDLYEAPRSQRTYYLRVATAGSMIVPLVAWSLKSFIQHQHGDWSALCMFYGLVFIMACFNAGVYGFTRQREYLPYVGYILAVGFVQFSLAGHTYQFLLPNDPWLTHRLLPAALATTLVCAIRFIGACSPSDRRVTSIARSSGAFYFVMVAASFVLPYSLNIKLLLVSMVLMASYATWYMARRKESNGANEVRLFFLGWCGPMLGAVIAAAHAAGLLPSNFFTDWALQIGIAVQLVLISSGLADRYNSMRGHLSQAHAQLSHQVDALSSALQLAEKATRQAEQATRAKDEFMATMSHEFRTPLNPIINLPEGLLEDFEQVRGALCTSCNTVFELEPDEQLVGVSCPECHALDSLHEQSTLQYVGNADAARRYLRSVEQSGHKLLRVVNGILDYAKLDAGGLKLVREKTQVRTLIEEVGSELHEMAEAAGVTLLCQPPDGAPDLYADSYRLRQVLLNLVENAIKFSRRGSTVIVGGSISSDGLLLSVHDEGMGIAEHDLARIFDSFEQVHKGNTRTHGGVGLGLSVARSLVHMHNGELWVDSELGRGSTFYVRIPTNLSETPPNEAFREPGKEARA